MSGLNPFCECTTPGLCTRHGISKVPRQHELCSGVNCDAAQCIKYWTAWEHGKMPGQTGPVAEPKVLQIEPVVAKVVSGRVATLPKPSGKGCCGKPKAPSKRPGPVTRAANLARAAAAHVADGLTPTPSVIQEHRSAVCATCVQNVNDECRLCGCPLSPNLLTSGKLGWRSSECPAGKWFRHRDQYVPFTKEPTRNLLYHIMPWKGRKIWQWNMDQLLKRIDLFTGKRVMAISRDPNCDPPEAVMKHLTGHGFQFIVKDNNPKLREVVTFLPLLETVQTLDPDSVTFYAHAKGVTHAGFWDAANPIKNWTEMQYETCLDNWAAVQDALESHSICGSFKRYGQFTTPGNNRWHFSGTFYWFRNKDVFSRVWAKVDQQFFGTESWPGRMFKEQEAACLFHDHCSDMYKLDYQRNEVYPELEKWRSAR